jgi:outer membrane protein TolC
MEMRRLVVTMLMTLALAGLHPTRGNAQAPAALPAAAAPPGAAAAGGVILPRPALQPTRPVRRLSIEEAVTLALDQNLDLRVERISPLIQDTFVAEARSVYAPELSTTITGDDWDRPAGNIFDGGDVVTNRFMQDDVGVVQQVPWKGGQYSAGWTGRRSTTTNVFTSFNPLVESNLNLNYTQPLVRNFGIDGFRQQIAVSRANRDISDIELRRIVVLTERTVRNAYWELVFARSFLEVQRQSLALAEESLRNNRTRVEVGTMAPIDIVEAENEVARNIEAVIRAEADLERAEDQLRTLVFDPQDTPDFWSISLQPNDSPVLQAREIDVDAAIRNALLNRTDLGTLDQNLEITDTDIRYFRNQQLPAVDLRVDYRLTGQGGERLIRAGGFPGTVVGTEQRSFGSTLGDILANEFPKWTVGVTVSYPFGTSAADAALERSRLERSRHEARRRSLELRIAAEVRDAARNVRTNLQRVEATRASRELAERRLEAEQRKFEVGLSTNFLVFQAQRDLATARNTEQQAILDYIRSLVDFEAVQEIPLGGVIP